MQPTADLLGDGDRAVLPAGAAEGDRQAATSLGLIAGHDERQVVGDEVEEARGDRLAEDELAHLGRSRPVSGRKRSM